MSEENRRRKVRHRGRRKKKKRNIGSNIILAVAIMVFLYSAFQLLCIFKEYNAGEQEYDSLQELVIQEEEVSNDETGEVEKPRFTVDFTKLLEMNSDTVAWIRFDNPDVINYPVVKSADNAEYLHTTFEGKQNSSGALFVDYRNTGDFTEENTFIYGHNMKNGSMFGRLRKYRSEEFCAENPYFYIYLPNGTEVTYQIFAVSIVQDTSEVYDMSYASEEEFQAYLDFVKAGAIYTMDVEVTTDSQIVSLSTCTSVTEHERLVVHGVKISER